MLTSEELAERSAQVAISDEGLELSNSQLGITIMGLIGLSGMLTNDGGGVKPENLEMVRAMSQSLGIDLEPEEWPDAVDATLIILTALQASGEE